MNLNSSHRFTPTRCFLALAIGVSLSASGRFAIAQNLFATANGNIFEFTPNGTKSTFATGLDEPQGLAFNTGGDLFVADAPAGIIYEYTPNGTRSTFATGLQPYPHALAFNSSGDLFFSDLNVTGPGAIYELTPNGSQSVFTSVEDQIGPLAFNSSGDLYVGARTDIYEFTPGGTLATAVGQIPLLEGLAFNSSGDLFFACEYDIYESVGGQLTNGLAGATVFASVGGSSPAFDSSGDLFVAHGISIYKFTPNGTQSVFASGVVKTNGIAGLAFCPVPPPAAKSYPWTSAVSGTWSNSGNWAGGVPNGIGDGAVFNVSTTAAVAVTLNMPVTLSSLQFGNSASASVGYTLSGTGSNTLTFNNSGNGAAISVTNGAHAIDAPVVLADNLSVTSSGTNAWTLSFGTASSITDDGNGYSLTMSGAGGTLILSGSDTYTGGTFVEAGTLIAANSEALPDGSSLIVGNASLFPSYSPVTPAAAASPVPEPGTLALLGTVVAALCVCGCVSRRGVRSPSEGRSPG